MHVQVLLAAAAAAGAALWAAAVVEEVLAAVQGLGVVLSARRRCWWRPASTFVPAERIRHVIINEVLRCVHLSVVSRAPGERDGTKRN